MSINTDSDLEKIAKAISVTFHSAKVSNVVIDDEFGNVTATVDGVTYVDCGYIEDYK